MQDNSENLLALYRLVDSYRGLCDAHSVDFFVSDHWQNIIPEEWKEPLEQEADDDVFLYPRHHAPAGFPSSLRKFLLDTNDLRLPGLLASSTDQSESSKDNSCGPLSHFGMNRKKQHEVLKFSKAVQEVMSINKLTQVLDLGSGKGYLSEFLALKYNYLVVGVDSNQINTDAASKRNDKVHKVWEKASQSKLVQESSDLNQREAITTNDGCVSDSAVMEDFSDSFDRLFESHLSVTENHPTSLEERAVLVVSQSKQTLLEATVNSYAEQKNRERTEFLITSKENNSFCPLTMELRVDEIHNFLSATEKISGGRFQPKFPFCLVGLHTCGDLGSTALRLYAEIPTARALCIVGCCYHHITESHDNGNKLEGHTTPGFPMSSLLRSVGAHIGRNGRMLACQTINKFSETTSGASLNRIHWRAILQVIFMRKFPELYEKRSKQITVGRFRHAPKDFPSYVSMALPKVGLTDSKISEKELCSIEREFHHRKKHMEIYLKLRGLLAPCIESLILLDRLQFLHEQVTGTDSQLAFTFDPRISPRCVLIKANKQ